jgi:predicted phage terminase large subunit-like protein
MDRKTLESSAGDLWRLTPCRVAERLTAGNYKRYRHIQFISRIIAQKVAKGGARLIISMPPRHGKSWLISRWVPAWFLSHWPGKNVILTSYEAGFASSWGRAVRNAIQEHSAALGVAVSQDSSAADRWDTTAGGGMITAGAGGPITGRGGHLIIIDDPIKNQEEADSPTYRQRTIDWFQSTLYTRAEPGASIVLLMTRWHQRDLAGFLLSDENETHKAWEEIRIPAIAEEGDPLGRELGEALCPERYDVGALSGIRKAVGSRVWAAEYQQRPSAEEGNIIRREWIRRYEKTPEKFDEQILSLDATFTGKATSDFVALEVWGRKGTQKYLLDIVHDRLGITGTIDALLRISRKYPTATTKLIEAAANGYAIEELLKGRVSGLILWAPEGDKVSRLNAVAPQFEAGNVFVPITTWADEFIDEIVTFPSAAHDDRVDACTMALLRLENSVQNQVGIMRILR